jgi:hypothetical protein
VTMAHYIQWALLTYAFTVINAPAISVPCGFTRDGLPVGLQIAGRWHDEVGVLRAAAPSRQPRRGRTTASKGAPKCPPPPSSERRRRSRGLRLDRAPASSSRRDGLTSLTSTRSWGD